MPIWGMCTACWIPIYKHTLSECVILIYFLLRRLLHEHASVLCYTHTACLLRMNVDFACLQGSGTVQPNRLYEHSEESACLHHQKRRNNGRHTSKRGRRHTITHNVTISFQKLDQSLIHNLLCITAHTKACEYSLYKTLLMMDR